MNRVLRYFLVLIAIVAHAAGATVRITREEPIADLFPATPEGQQWLGAIATDGTHFLVFWSGAGGFYATPVTAEGNVAGPRVVISLSPGSREVSACWTGSVYLTTWRDDAENAIYAATLSRDGSVVSGPSVVVRGAVPRSGSLASNGRQAFMAYATTDATPAVRGAIFDAAGVAVAVNLPLPVDDISTSLVEVVPRVASNGSEFALVWRSGELVPISGNSASSTPPPLRKLVHTFHLLNISDSGAVIAPPIAVARVEQTGDFGVTFGAGVYVITAIESHLVKIGQPQPRLVRVVVDARSGAITTLPVIETNGRNAGVLWNGSRFIAYWMNYSTSSFELLTLQFSPDQEAVSPSPVSAVSGAHLAHSPLLAWNGKIVVGAWSEDIFDTHGGHTAIRGATFDANSGAWIGSPPPFLISMAWTRQFTPAIASSDSESLIVWIESSHPSSGRLVGTRVAPNGHVIDRTPLEIAPVVSLAQAPRVTFAGMAYLVVWGEPEVLSGQTTIVARRVGVDASLGPRVPLATGWGATTASNATTTLVALRGQQHLVGYRFDARGEPLDTTPIIIGEGYLPEVATNGTDFLVAWNVGSNHWQFAPADLTDVFATRVTAAGAVDAASLPIATGPSDQFIEAAASDGRDYIIFFGLRDPRHPNGVLASKRVLREGQLDGVTPGDDGTIVGQLVTLTSVVHSASRFWLAGVHATHSAGSIVLLHTDHRGNAGEPISLASYESSITPGFASLARASGGWLQIVYARRMMEVPYTGTSRIFLRFASEATQSRARPARH